MAPAATLQLTFAALCWSNNIVAQRFSTENAYTYTATRYIKLNL